MTSGQFRRAAGQSVGCAPGTGYFPITERGAVVYAARQARAAIREMCAWLDLARERYGIEREAGPGRVFAVLAALTAVTMKDRSADRNPKIVRECLVSVLGRSREQGDAPKLVGHILRGGGSKGSSRGTPSATVKWRFTRWTATAIRSLLRMGGTRSGSSQ